MPPKLTSSMGVAAAQSSAHGGETQRPTPPTQREQVSLVEDARVSSQPSPPLSHLETLPQTLFHHILTFSLCGDRVLPDEPESYAESDDPMSDAEVDLRDNIALISKTLRPHALEIQAQLQLGKMVVHPTTGSRREMLAFRRRFILQRAFLREVVFFVWALNHFDFDEATAWLPPVVRQFSVCLSHAPCLESLDLRRLLANVTEIVRVTAANCPQLTALQLPSDFMDREEEGRIQPDRSPDTRPLVDAVFAGLPLWHRSHGGLRQLRLPNRPQTNRFVDSVDFLQRVCTYCPQIELLDGYRLGRHEILIHARDQWIVDHATWERFCATCSQLRSLDWIAAPWADSFFEIFARYPKLQLTELLLSTSMRWDWPSYFSEVGATDAAVVRAGGGFGSLATRVDLLLQACPSLKRLVIHTNTRAGLDEATQVAIQRLPEDERPVGLVPFKPENALNQDLFGDAFVELLVRRCPQLEEFAILDDFALLTGSLRNGLPLTLFTDAALQSLSTLPFFSSLTLKASSVTDVGIYNMICGNYSTATPQTPRCSRSIHLTIPESSATSMDFYDTMYGFTRLLRTHSGPLDQITAQQLALRVVNDNPKTLDPSEGAPLLADLRNELRALREMYPTLTFRVEVSRMGTAPLSDGAEPSEYFGLVYAFGLYTQTATAHWWEDLEPDGEFVVMYPAETDENEEDDEEGEENEDEDAGEGRVLEALADQLEGIALGVEEEQEEEAAIEEEDDEEDDNYDESDSDDEDYCDIETEHADLADERSERDIEIRPHHGGLGGAHFRHGGTEFDEWSRDADQDLLNLWSLH